MMPRNSSRNNMDNPCQECGCHCDSCVNNNSIYLHQEIESLKQKLKEREQQILTMESQILCHANQYPNGEMQALRDDLYHFHDKYERLLENYRKLQKVNQGLEDKLLRVADRFENERIVLTQNITDMTNKLNDAQIFIADVKKQNEQYKKDYDLAIRLIQSQSQTQHSITNLESFPQDFQERVQQYFDSQRQADDNNRDKEPVRVPIPTFPPTAVLYSLNQQSTKMDKKEYKYSQSTNPSLILPEIFNNRMNTCPNCNEKFYDSPELISPYLNENSDMDLQNIQNVENYGSNKTIII